MPVVFACGLIFGLILGQSISSLSAQQTEEEREAFYRNTRLFATVMEMIRTEYVDADKVNYEDLAYSALRGMLNSLDKHCEFLDPRRFQEMRTDTEGEFGGVGLYFNVSEGNSLVVTAPVEGGPAFKAGILPGDVIFKINGVESQTLGRSESSDILRGEPGDPVQLTIYRESEDRYFDVEIIREIINIPTVRSVSIVSSGLTDRDPEMRIGYIRMTQFGEKTLQEFDRAMVKLIDEGMKGLILDVRNNPGGLLEVAVQVAGRFVEEGTSIAFTEGRYGASDRTYYPAKGKTHYTDLPVVVLQNSNSASGAEIVAGALRDLRRAVLVGETSYGKGSVQTVQPVDPSMTPPVAVRLTTAKYFTPSRNLIHEVGVSPDIFVNISADEERDVIRKQNIHLLPKDGKEEVKNFRDEQYERAMSVLESLMVYEKRVGRKNAPLLEPADHVETESEASPTPTDEVQEAVPAT